MRDNHVRLGRRVVKLFASTLGREPGGAEVSVCSLA